MTGHTVTIRHTGEERFEVMVDGIVVGAADHDNDGWAGMATVYDTVVTMTHQLGLRLELI